MSTNNRAAPPARRRSVPPVWWAVLGRRLGAWSRRTPPRAARAAARSVAAVPTLAAALLLVAAMKSAPLVRSGVSSPLWGRSAAALAERALRPVTGLAAAGALGLGYLVGPGSVLGFALAVPAAGMTVLLGCRTVYRHTAFGRARRRFGAEGWADFWELHRGMSAHAVRHVALTQRPSVAATLPEVPSRREAGVVAVAAVRARRSAMVERLPVSECGTWLGRSAVGPWWGVSCYAAFRDVVGLIAPPQSGKTGLMIHHVVDHPGAVISTSTKPDIYLYTAVLRAAVAASGRVELFNPDDLGGLGSTLRWCPVRGCADYRFATTRAGLLVGARERKSNDDSRWDEWAAEVLSGLLMVADLDARTMADVARWVHNPTHAEHGADAALRLMRGAYSDRVPREVADALGQILASKAEKTRDSVFFAMRGAVGFMSDPTVAALCTPGRDVPVFDVERFLAERGTLYLLGSEEQNAATAPLLAAFTGHVFATAKDLATRPGRGTTGQHAPGRVATGRVGADRLDPPLLISLDEAALITPVPLPTWVSDAGGRGIHIVWSVQTPSQLRDRWGDEGADTIINATNALMVYGGLKAKDDLAEVSEWCGYRHELVPDPDGDGPGHAKFERVPVCPPDRVRLVPPWHALLVYRTTVAIPVRLWPAWRRQDIAAAGRPEVAAVPTPPAASAAPIVPIDDAPTVPIAPIAPIDVAASTAVAGPTRDRDREQAAPDPEGDRSGPGRGHGYCELTDQEGTAA